MSERNETLHWHYCMKCSSGIHCRSLHCIVPEDIPMCRACERKENEWEDDPQEEEPLHGGDGDED